MRSKTMKDGTTHGSTAMTATANAGPSIERRVMPSKADRPDGERDAFTEREPPLDALHRDAAEESGRPDDEHQHDDRERRGEPQLVADRLDVGAQKVDRDAEDQPADHGADRAFDPAEDGRRERVDDLRLHHVRVEQDDRSDHDPRDRADDGGEPPAEREHPADADAEHPALLGIERGGAHREPELRLLE